MAVVAFPDNLHPRCPNCDAGMGKLRSVSVSATAKTLSYVCKACERIFIKTTPSRMAASLARADPEDPQS